MIKTAKKQFEKASKLILLWILIAIGFGFLYHFIPGSVISNKTGEAVNSLLETIYFSFTTIITIGYGDLVPIGFARSLTAIEGLIGWILFGVIVFQVVSVKEDAILREVYKLSNDQYLSRVKNFLFISNTNLTRFIKNVKSKKIAKDSIAYELSVISTNLKSNIEDSTSFLLTNKNSSTSKLDEVEIISLINGINLCMNNLLEALNKIQKDSKEYLLCENIDDIVKSGKKVYDYYKTYSKSEKVEELKNLYIKLENFGREHK